MARTNFTIIITNMIITITGSTAPPTHTFLGEVIPNPIITITTMISIIIISSRSTPANLKATLRVDDHSVPDEIGLDMHRQGS